MAYERNSGPGSNQSNDDNWKAAGFINLYLPQADGTRRKVGAIPLKLAKPFEKAVADRLKAGGEEALKAFANAVEFDFNTAEAKPVDATGIGF